MKKQLIYGLFFCCGFVFSNAANSVEWVVDVTVPVLDVEPYHRPYVAIWLETEKRKGVETLSVWYGDEQEEWLKDMRQWWRKLGRSKPFDQVSGATRKPGNYQIHWQSNSLAAGTYYLCVEAAREAGGRELLRQKIQIKDVAQPQTFSLAGQRELGLVTITLRDK